MATKNTGIHGRQPGMFHKDAVLKLVGHISCHWVRPITQFPAGDRMVHSIDQSEEVAICNRKGEQN